MATENWNEVGLPDPMILARQLGHDRGNWTVGLHGGCVLAVDGQEGRQELERPESAGVDAWWNGIRVVFEGRSVESTTLPLSPLLERQK